LHPWRRLWGTLEELAANSGLTGLASNKVRRAGLCHQAGGELEKIQIFLATSPGNDSKRRE
jgi:hypothetical protein